MWQKAALSIELQKRMVYGIDIWIKTLVPPLVQVFVAYYLWQAVFANNGSQTIGGYTFEGMMLYYVIASTLYQLVQPDVGIVLRDIYDGTLTKFLFYPLSFFQFKFITHVAQMITVGAQLVIGLLIYYLVFGSSAWGAITWQSVVLSLFCTFFSGYLFFITATAIEVIGFWVEAVWGLVLMLQFTTNLLGGKLLPLSVFPIWLSQIIDWTPFPYMVSFPTKLFLNELSNQQILFGVSLTFGWCCIMTVFAKMLWNAGSYNYSGTGM